MMPCDQVNVCPAIVVCGAGKVPTVNMGEPVEPSSHKSWRTSLAKRTAPSMLSAPAPCSNWLKPARGCAVYIKIILTRLGVSDGLAWSSSAAAPAATGVAIDEPLRYIIFRVLKVLTPASSAGLDATR